MAAPSYSASEFRNRISFQRRNSVSDGMGGTKEGPLKDRYTGIRAKIAPMKGGEEVRAARLSGIRKWEIVVRSTEATREIDSGDVIVNEVTGEKYNILWVGNLDEKNRFLMFMCESGGSRVG